MKMRKIETLCVHSGIFHFDDVMSTAIVKGLNPDVKILRAPNHNLPNADLYVDCGGKLDEDHIDHHQWNINNLECPAEAFRNNGAPYAAAGLCWKRFGRDLLAKMGCISSQIESAWEMADKEIMQPIDGFDVGVLNLPKHPFLSMASVVSSFNVNTDAGEEFSHQDHNFRNAVDFVSIYLNRQLIRVIAVVMSKAIVEKSPYDKNLRLLKLKRACAWQGHISENVLFVLFEDKLRGQFNIQVAPMSPTDRTFKFRPGKGLEGIEKDIYVDHRGFMASFSSPERAIAALKKFLNK